MTETDPEIHAPCEGKGNSLYNVKLTSSVDTESRRPAAIVPYSDHVATIDTLPTEVLELIFILYLDLSDQDRAHYYRHTLLYLYRLTAVSAR